MSFEDLFKEPIPIVEAATFFTDLKGGMFKQAEWTDPPDMEGLLEGKFNVPIEQVLDKLKGVITAKYRKMVAYYTYSNSVNDMAGDSLAAVFDNISYDEKCGAKFYTQRAAALGGPVHLDAIEPPPASTNPVGIVKVMIRAEQECIAAQRELRQCVGEENAMRIGIESQLEKDQHHLDELWRLLPKGELQALELGTTVQGLDEEPPPAVGGEEAQPLAEEEPPEVPPAPAEGAPPELPMEEVPPEEKAASVRMEFVLMKQAKAEPPTDTELKEKGRERGVTGLAAEAMREKGRRGERAGKTVGMLGGGAAGAALGRKFLGGTAGTLGGMAAGALAGRTTGSELGTEYDIVKNASELEVVASMRMDAVLHKLAEEPTPGAIGDEAGDGMAAPTVSEMQPQNYLAAEMQAQQAQGANEANYYRQQLGEAQQASTMAQQQMTDVQSQLDQLQQQADQSGEQIQQAAQEAMAARDDAVNATMEVAKARIGAQKMRQSMLELASQDPAALGEEAMAPQPQVGPDGQPVSPPLGQEAPQEPGAPDAGMQGPPPDEGPAGSAAPPGAAPGAEPPAGEPDMTGPVGPPPGAQGEGAMPTTQLKTGSVALMGALGGAALGASGSYMSGRQAPALRDSVQRLEASQDGTFGQAAALSAARGASAGADLSAAHPVRSALSGGLSGGLAGAAIGPSLVSGVRELAGRHIPAAYRRATGG